MLLKARNFKLGREKLEKLEISLRKLSGSPKKSPAGGNLWAYTGKVAIIPFCFEYYTFITHLNTVKS